MTISKWKSVPVHPRTVFDILNENFIRIENTHDSSLPNFAGCKSLLVGSDYSGEERNAPYAVYSFLFISLESWSAWEPKRLEIRKRFLSDSRRMSFKKLNDSQRYRALIPLLEAANSLSGLSFTVAINKNCESLFSGNPPLDLNNPDFVPFRKWKISVLEKTFLITNFIGFLLAGLAYQWQNVLWFTDEDSIAANDERVRELTLLFSWVSSLYLKFNLGHLRCGTSRCDDGSRQIEDFLAIPDLIAGAISEQFKIRAQDHFEIPDGFIFFRGDLSEKTQKITWWFSNSQWPLKRLVTIIDPSKDGRGHKVSWYHFHDQTG
jgi:hypothetical protein